MSPLEAAKRLVHDGESPSYQPIGKIRRCRNCNAPVTRHAPDCPWLSMPQIVAALEAYERMADQMADQCPICRRAVQSGLGTYPWTCANGHTLYFGGGALSARNRMPPEARPIAPPGEVTPHAD